MSEAYRTMLRNDLSKEEINKAIKRLTAEVNQDLIRTNDYDKFGNGEYITVETINRILNEAFNYNWSWEITDWKEEEGFVVCIGKLSAPGFGTKDGIGQVRKDKKDNSTAYSAAASFAFKNAAKRYGVAPNIFDPEDWDAPVFEHEVNDTAPDNQQTEEPKQEKKSENAYEPKTKKQEPTSVKEKMAELKEAYSIETKAQFVAFAQIWDPEIEVFEDLTQEDFEDLHTYVEDNPQEFEDFVASDY